MLIMDMNEPSPVAFGFVLDIRGLYLGLTSLDFDSFQMSFVCFENLCPANQFYGDGIIGTQW
jgi:hypothetical protein